MADILNQIDESIARNQARFDPFGLPPLPEPVGYNEGGWYEIDGMESWHGSDSTAYLRRLLADDEHRALHARAQAVLDFVTRVEVSAPHVDAAPEPDPAETLGADGVGREWFRRTCPHPGCDWTRISTLGPLLGATYQRHLRESHHRATPQDRSWWRRMFSRGANR